MQFSRLYEDKGSSFGLTGVVDDGVSIQEQVRSTHRRVFSRRKGSWRGPKGCLDRCRKSGHHVTVARLITDVLTSMGRPQLGGDVHDAQRYLGYSRHIAELSPAFLSIF